MILLAIHTTKHKYRVRKGDLRGESSDGVEGHLPNGLSLAQIDIDQFDAV